MGVNRVSKEHFMEGNKTAYSDGIRKYQHCAETKVNASVRKQFKQTMAAHMPEFKACFHRHWEAAIRSCPKFPVGTWKNCAAAHHTAQNSLATARACRSTLPTIRPKKQAYRKALTACGYRSPSEGASKLGAAAAGASGLACNILGEKLV